MTKLQLQAIKDEIDRCETVQEVNNYMDDFFYMCLGKKYGKEMRIDQDREIVDCRIEKINSLKGISKMKFEFADEPGMVKKILSEQHQRILNQLLFNLDYLHVGNCDPRDAHKLATRIGELINKHGCNIDRTQWHEYTNGEGKKVRVRKYRLII